MTTITTTAERFKKDSWSVSVYNGTVHETVKTFDSSTWKLDRQGYDLAWTCARLVSFDLKSSGLAQDALRVREQSLEYKPVCVGPRHTSPGACYFPITQNVLLDW